MYYYLIRRILYFIPILLVINVLTFALFFVVNTPDQIAYVHLGGKYVTKAAVDDWKHVHGYDLPLFFNDSENKLSKKFTNTIFFNKSLKLFAFDFGVSDRGRDIGAAISQRAIPSLLIAVPELLIGVIVNISVALFIVLLRNTAIETIGLIKLVVLMSISLMFYIIGGQFIIAKLCRLVPISGYTDGIGCIMFLILPIIIGVVAGIGADARWYRTFFIDELTKEYVVAARAKGLSELRVLFTHVLKNALVPIVTGIVVVIPLLFMGSLLMESFFAIPGLGAYTIDAINEQDFAIVRVMVFLGSVLYLLGLILTDITYVLIDPRIRLK